MGFLLSIREFDSHLDEWVATGVDHGQVTSFENLHAQTFTTVVNSISIEIYIQVDFTLKK